jgi:hypothetical protein
VGKVKPQHTPGKWDIRYERDHFDSKQSTLRIIDPATTGHPQGPLTLVTINVAAFAPHMEELLANARLIAAAPELLGMLKEAVRLAELNRPMGTDTLRAAREAIAKAANATIIEDE